MNATQITTQNRLIIADDKIPFLEGIFEAQGFRVEYYPGKEITPEIAAQAEALIIRTRTHCNNQMMDSAKKLRIIATATIGFDHIDMDAAKNHGIEVCTSAGCNARGVVQYVMAALSHLDIQPNPSTTLGIVGVGNVGSILMRVARNLGYKVMLCDPPRKAQGWDETSYSLEELMSQCDVISLHVPLNESTENMINHRTLSLAKPNLTMINTSRGEVVCQDALKQALIDKSIHNAVIDVWQNEPKIDQELMNLTALSTPHIAGYSLQGKAMGTALAVRAIAKQFGIDELKDWYPTQSVSPTQINESISWHDMQLGLVKNYSIINDSDALRSNPDMFEELRGNYNYRPEFF